MLPARQDGALSAADTAVAEAHLAKCPDCAREAALLQEIGTLLRRDPLPLSQVTLPAGDQIARSIIEAEAVERRNGWRSLFANPPRTLGWTAGLAVAAALTVVAVRPPQTRPLAPAPPAVTQPASSSGFWIEDDERTGRDVIVAPAVGLGQRKS
jgi:anti-sigma factor RsiW